MKQVEGHHLTYTNTIRKVAQEVSREFAAPAGVNGHGYEVATPEDIEQRVHLKLIEAGYDDAYFDALDDPQASLRLFARNAAKREVEARHRKHDGTGQGFREHPFSPLGTASTSDRGPSDSPYLRHNPSPLAQPMTEILRDELELELRSLAEDLLSKVSPFRSAALALWVLEGLDAKAIADRLNTSYGHARNHVSEGQKSLDPDEVASLRALRAYWHPDAKRPKPLTEGAATALLDLLAT